VNSEETVKLCRVVAAACPQQAMDEYTPDAWHPLLKDLGYGDCQAAVIAVGKRQPFIAPAEIRAEVTRIRNDRVERAFIDAPPHELTDDTRAYQRALQQRTRQAADGALPSVHEHLAIAGPAAAEIEGPRETSKPEPLRDALAELKAKLGPARARQAPLASPQEIALRKAAESRAAREAAEQAEGSQAS
jgi:hypothetical protein